MGDALEHYVAELAEHFLQEGRERYGREVTGFTPSALEWLAAQPWPGNVRQLRQVVERALLVGEGEVVDTTDLQVLSEAAPREAASAPLDGDLTLEEMERRMIEQSLRRAGGNVSQAAKALGLSRAALYRRCEKYGLEIERS